MLAVLVWLGPGMAPCEHAHFTAVTRYTHSLWRRDRLPHGCSPRSRLPQLSTYVYSACMPSTMLKVKSARLDRPGT